MSRIIRLLSSDIVIPFREWGPKNSSHNGRNSQGITPESFDGRASSQSAQPAQPAPPIPRRSRFVQAGFASVWGHRVEVRESKIENPQSKISRFASVWGHQSKCEVTTKTEGSYHCREWPNAPSIVHGCFRSEGISAMPSRFVSLAILVYWCIAAFCLLTWEVLPELTLGYPPDLRRSPRPVTPPSRSRGASRSSMIPKLRTSGDRSARRSPHRSASRMGGSSSAAG